MYCHICKEEIDYADKNFMFLHVRKVHGYTPKQYYDKFIRNYQKGEGICLTCGKETPFLGNGKSRGYRTYCSIKCRCNNKDFKQKVKRILKEKYGNENYVNVEKMKLTNLSKYNHVCSLHNVDIQSEIKKKVLNKRKSHIINLLKNNYNLINCDDVNLYTLECIKCKNIFNISKELFYLRSKGNHILCTICNPVLNKVTSNQEKELLEFIKDNYNGEVIENTKNIISPYELDVYIPQLKLAFEFNGLYWHSELNKPNDYHLMKTKMCEHIGIHLIHIYEDDWIYKQDIVKSRILNLLGKSNILYARKCNIKEISFTECKDFLDENHLQKSSVSKINLGLFFNEELVSVMTFGKMRRNLGNRNIKANEYELLRFCNKLGTNVIGGASKLFKYFINIYEPLKIVSYADRSWTMNDGNSVYEKIGFKKTKATQVNYSYIFKDMRKNRFGFRKDILIKEGFDKNKSEHEIMLEREIYRIYDCGQLKFEYIINN